MENKTEKKQAFNPYLPSYEYVPDGEPRVFGSRVYVYGSHDKFDGSDFCVNDYCCCPFFPTHNYSGGLSQITKAPKTAPSAVLGAFLGEDKYAGHKV